VRPLSAAPSPPMRVESDPRYQSTLDEIDGPDGGQSRAAPASVAARTPVRPPSAGTPVSRRSRPSVAGDAAVDRLTRSAMKLEAEMEALSGLLGEEQDAMTAADRRSDAKARSVQRRAHELEDANAALKRLMHNVRPYLAGEAMVSDVATALKDKIDAARSLLAADAADAAEADDDDAGGARLDDYLRAGSFGTARRAAAGKSAYYSE
jgi:hypothetical protein